MHLSFLEDKGMAKIWTISVLLQGSHADGVSRASGEASEPDAASTVGTESQEQESRKPQEGSRGHLQGAMESPAESRAVEQASKVRNYSSLQIDSHYAGHSQLDCKPHARKQTPSIQEPIEFVPLADFPLIDGLP